MKNIRSKIKYIATIILLLTIQISSNAQDITTSNSKSAIDSLMLSNQKIFVVVAVVFVIVLGLFIYLFSLDKKLARLEGRMKE